MRKHNKSQRKKRGQALTEYIVLVALLGIASISVVQILGFNIKNKLSSISDAMIGHKNKASGKRASEEDLKLNDLGDFHKALGEEKN